MKQIIILLFAALSNMTLVNIADAKLSPAEIACNRALNQGDYQVALDRADALLTDNPKNAVALTCQGRAYFSLEKTKQAISAFEQAEQASDEGYDKSFASLLIGHVYKNTAQLDRATTAYQRSLDYAKAINYQPLIINNHLNIGHVYTLQSTFDKALAAYEQAYAIAANDGERADSESNIAASHFALHDYDHAVEYEIKALLMFEKVGSLDQYANALANLATYQTAGKRLNDAERSCQKLIKFAQDNGGAYYEAQGQLLLAKVKVAQADKDAAKSLLATAKATAAKTKDPALMQAIEDYAKTL